jgi:uncharacterized membrane protein YhaH (DUF805 family)
MAGEKSPVEWVLTPIRKYAQFSGRAPRAEYWWYYLVLLIAYLGAVFIDRKIGSRIVGPYGILAVLLWLGLLIPTLAVGVRRMHDTNRTGWWILAPVVPYVIGFTMAGPAVLDPARLAEEGGAMIFLLLGFVLAIVVLVFTVLPGTAGPNDHGPDPYGADGEEVFA